MINILYWCGVFVLLLRHFKYFIDNMELRIERCCSWLYFIAMWRMPNTTFHT